jgi:hypothetical protein
MIRNRSLCRRGQKRRHALPLFALALLALAQGEPGVAKARPAQPVASSVLRTTIQFNFQINDLLTNHQFAGQTNSFDVTYEYVGTLKGAPAGVVNPVAHDTFPYFESVRDDMKNYILSYPDQENFYELMGSDIGRYLLGRYPQMRWIEVVIQIPAFGPVGFVRTAKVRVERAS